MGLGIYVEASEELPEACKPDSDKRLLEVHEVVQQIVVVFLHDNVSTNGRIRNMTQ